MQSQVSFRRYFRISSWIVSLLLVCVGCASVEPKESDFRVLTYNIHHGEGTDGRIDLKRIARVIKEEKADIVALQEVDRGVLRSGRRDLPAELAKLTGMSVFFDNNLSYQGGEYGNAVLTRFPILMATNTHYQMLEPKEQRGVIQLVLWINGKRLLFLDTHLDFRETEEGEKERLLHVATMKELIAAHGSIPVIVCGDFNSTPNSGTHVAMKKFMQDSWELKGKGAGLTIPPEKPRTRIDYIWVSDDVKVNNVWVPQTEASDHLPVAGEFRLR